MKYPLPVTDALLQQQSDKATCAICEKWLKRFGRQDEASPDDICSERAMLDICRRELPSASFDRMREEIRPITERIMKRSAWRIEGTLREFPKFDPLNLWFEFPAHAVDSSGVLADVETDEKPIYHKRKKINTETESSENDGKISKKKMQMYNELEIAYSALEFNQERIRIGDLEKALNLKRDAVRDRIDNHPNFYRDNGGFVFRRNAENTP